MDYPNLNGKLILIVEDEEINYLCLKHMLSSANAKLLWSVNGKEAIINCEKYTESIDMVLMDLRMPLMNGYDTVRIIKQKWPGIPVVAQATYADSEDKSTIYSSGFDAYITKPVNGNLLYEVIEKFIIN